MKKILLAMLIIATGLKIIGDSSAFAYKYTIIKLAIQDEESKKDKEENKHSKRYHEDIYDNNIIEHSLFNSTEILPPSSNNQKFYFGFKDKPNTPPPDFI